MNRKEKYSKENMMILVAQSESIKDIVLKLGLQIAGGSYKQVHKYLKAYAIDISHFDPNIGRKKPRKSIAIPLERVLVDNSTYSRSNLKVRLYKSGLKSPFCEMAGCGQGEEWMGKKMSLILDHIDGKPNNNKLENLRIVCPNCNATLDTHAGKNTLKQKEKRLLREKGIEYTKPKVLKVDRRTLAAGIPKPATRKVKERPSHEDLLKMVAEQGYSAVGRSYGVSDNAIRKWLK